MKKEVAVPGFIAVIILFAAAIFCVWAGKKVVQKLPKPVETINSQITTEHVSAENSGNSEKIHLALGNPSNATSDVSNSDNYLMINDEFALSYNRSRSSPNWVAWRITKTEMSDMPRDDSYRPDNRLPNGWKRVTPGDYSGSGYTRGHMCPSADRDKNSKSMASTFLMTNMVPQTQDLNAGPWADLEGYLRSLAWRGNDVYVIAGVYGDKGKIKRKITIPTNNWKIGVIVRSSETIADFDKNTQVVAVDMPNIEGIENTEWKSYRTSIREIEKKTGYHFLSNLPAQLREKLEN